jgi:hypothetical protein
MAEFSAKVQKAAFALKGAFAHDQVSLVEAWDRTTGKPITLLCITVRENEGKTVNLVPIAVMIEGAPADVFIPPDEKEHYDKLKETNWKEWLSSAPLGLLRAEQRVHLETYQKTSQPDKELEENEAIASKLDDIWRELETRSNEERKSKN